MTGQATSYLRALQEQAPSKHQGPGKAPGPGRTMRSWYATGPPLYMGHIMMADMMAEMMAPLLTEQHRNYPE